MKKLLLLGALLLWQFTSAAQDFRFGLKGGVNYSDVAGKDFPDGNHDYKLGWHAGIAVNITYPGSEVLSIQPELLFSQKGYLNAGAPISIRLYAEEEGGPVRLNYLDLPIMLNFKKGVLVFEIGPQFSYLVAMENEATTTRTFPDGSTLTSPSPRRFGKEHMNKLDIGFATGLRLETANGMGVGLRYNQGFIKLPDSDIPAGAVHPPAGANQCFQLFVSYLFPK